MAAKSHLFKSDIGLFDYSKNYNDHYIGNLYFI